MNEIGAGTKTPTAPSHRSRREANAEIAEEDAERARANELIKGQPTERDKSMQDMVDFRRSRNSSSSS
jgi:hypothetical protein